MRYGLFQLICAHYVFNLMHTTRWFGIQSIRKVTSFKFSKSNIELGLNFRPLVGKYVWFIRSLSDHEALRKVPPDSLTTMILSRSWIPKVTSVKTYRAESNPKRKKRCKYLFTDTGTQYILRYVIFAMLSKNFNWSLSHLMNLMEKMRCH